MSEGRGLRPSVFVVGLVLVSVLPACEQLVVNEVPLVEVRITPDPVSLLEGETQTLEAHPIGPGGETLPERSVTWTASPSEVASISPDGALLGVTPGTAEVTARVDGVESSVGVTVLEGPRLRLSPSGLLLAAPAGSEDPVERVVQVENEGGGALSSLTASVQLDNGAEAGWLTASLSGSNAPTTLVVRAEATSLEAGTYRGRVIVDDPAARNGSQEVEVEFEVGLGPPIIHIVPNSVQFSAESGTRTVATQELSVEHTGGTQVEDLVVKEIRHVSGVGGWLEATLSGSEPPAVLTLEASARFLAPGEFTAEVDVTSESFPTARATVRVTFQVQ